MNWSSRPFVRIFILYAAGILLAYHLPDATGGLATHFLFMMILFLVGLSIIFVIKTISPCFIISIGSVNAILILTLGYTSANVQLPEGNISYPEEKCLYSARVITQAVATEKSIKMVLAIQPVSDTANLGTVNSKVMAYFQGNEIVRELQVGDRLLFAARLSRTSAPMNPYEFDYAEFLQLKGIYHTVYLPSDDWMMLKSSAGWSFRKTANMIRNHFLEMLRKNGLDGKEYAVSAAIILGYDELMESDLRQDFINAGAMHILCVSGLHVGVIYLVVNFLLSFLNRRRYLQIVRVVVLLLVVWSYAMITGLSPSVQRSSVMISLFIIGNNLKRSRDPYNTLAASAVVLLAFDPLILFNLGFQLSYTAVFGILTFHSPLYKLIHFKNAFIDKLWSIFVLSIAAQLGTFPLALHYFHFFPTYFWIINLFIFPLSFLIISCGFIFLICSWVPLLSGVLGYLLSTFVYILNYTVGLVEYLPWHGLESIHFPLFKVLLVYGFILLVFAVSFKKQILFLKQVVIVLLLIIGIDSYRSYIVLNQKRIAIYSINNHTAIDFIIGRECYFLADSALLLNDRKQKYHLNSARVHWGLRRPKITSTALNAGIGSELTAAGNFYKFCGKRILILDGSGEYAPLETHKVVLDAIIVIGKKKMNVSDLTGCFEFDLLVVDASVPYWKRKKILEQSKEAGIRVNDVKTEGAFIMELHR